MAYNCDKIKSVKRSKEKNRKLGKRNIYDIICNTPQLNLKQKIDYIRHHYVYYDGNYDYFYLKDGKRTPRWYQLNKIIYGIVKRKLSPNQLTLFNQKIMLWRKNRDEKIATITKFKEDLNKETGNIPKWKLDVANKTMISKANLETVEKYLNTDSCNLTKVEIDTISYKDLFGMAKDWQRKQKNTQ